MSQKVKLSCYIETLPITEEAAKIKATELAIKLDKKASKIFKKAISKVYYIVPELNKIYITVTEDDASQLGLASNIISELDIDTFPLERLPAPFVSYKELIIKKDTEISLESILNAGQAMVEEEAQKIFPFQIPVVKIINYGSDDLPSLIMPKIFGENIFSSLGELLNSGDADAGQKVLNNDLSILGYFPELGAVLLGEGIGSYFGEDYKNEAKEAGFTITSAYQITKDEPLVIDISKDENLKGSVIFVKSQRHSDLDREDKITGCCYGFEPFKAVNLDVDQWYQLTGIITDENIKITPKKGIHCDEIYIHKPGSGTINPTGSEDIESTPTIDIRVSEDSSIDLEKVTEDDLNNKWNLFAKHMGQSKTPNELYPIGSMYKKSTTGDVDHDAYSSMVDDKRWNIFLKNMKVGIAILQDGNISIISKDTLDKGTLEKSLMYTTNKRGNIFVYKKLYFDIGIYAGMWQSSDNDEERFDVWPYGDDNKIYNTNSGLKYYIL